MVHFHHRYLKTLMALIMAVGILAPSMIKLAHAFHGHWDEQQCVAYGTDHIHNSNLECDFNDHTLASKVLFASQFIYVPVVVPQPHYSNTYFSFVFESFERRNLPPRAPPVLSPSWT